MSAKKEPITHVVFRVWPNACGTVLALFPYVDFDVVGHCTSYEHVGQHGAADYAGCISRTRPAKPAEYVDLKRELTKIGYRLKVIQRASRGAR